jgi:hypothetical protein
LEGNTDENPLIVKVFVAMSDSSAETNLERNAMHPITVKRQQALKDVLDKSRHSKKLRGETHIDGKFFDSLNKIRWYCYCRSWKDCIVS